MSQEPEDISRWIQELVSRSSRQQMQAMQRLSSLLQRVTSGELDQASVRQEYSRFIRDESAGFVEDLTRLGLSFQTALLELNRKYSDRFFDQVLGSAMPESPAPNGSASGRKEIGLQMSGIAGEDLERTFIIENKREDDETVTFLVSEFTDEESGEAFRPPLQIQPPRLALRPGEERVVSIRLPLLQEMFKPGRAYRASILARGHSDVNLALRVEVTESPSRGEAASTGTAQETAGIAIRTSPRSKAKKTAANASARKATSAAAKVSADDLTALKGIGSATADRLEAAGIRTFTALASASPSRLREILGEAGSQRSARGHWIEQARLAHAGKLAELEALWKTIR